MGRTGEEGRVNCVQADAEAGAETCADRGVCGEEQTDHHVTREGSGETSTESSEDQRDKWSAGLLQGLQEASVQKLTSFPRDAWVFL